MSKFISKENPTLSRLSANPKFGYITLNFHHIVNHHSINSYSKTLF